MTGLRTSALLATLAFAAASIVPLQAAAATADKPLTEMSQAEAERYLDARLASDTSGAIGSVIRSQLPQDYPGLRRRLAASFRADVDTETLYWKTRQEMQILYVAHKNDLAAAPASTLMALARAEATYVRALQANGPGMCARYITDGSTLVGAPGEDAAAQAALDEADLARIAAIRAGLDSPQSRLPAAEADSYAWGVAVAQHEGSKLAIQYFDDGWLRKASQRDMCSALVAYYDGLLALPPETGAKIFLSLYATWRQTPIFGETQPAVSTEAAARQIVDDWATKGGDQGLEAALKRLMPNDYEAFLKRMTPLVLAGFEQAAIDRRRDDFLFGLFLVHLDDLKAAPDDALQSWARQESAYLHALQADGADACASNVSGVSVEASKSRVSDRSLLAFHESIVGRWRAIRAGMDHPVVRPEAVETDRQAWDASAGKRMGAKRMTDMLRADWRGSASHKALCAADVDMFDALVELPLATAAPLLALSAAGIGRDPINPYVGLSQANAEKAIDAAVDAVPQEDRVKALKTHLPADYQAYLHSMADAARKGGSDAAVADKSDAAVAEVVSRRRKDLLTAPAALAADFFGKQAAMLRILREEDPARCAGIFFSSDGDPKPWSARAKQALDLAYAAEFKAMRAGMDKPSLRSSASDSEVVQWSDAFTAAIPAKAYQIYEADSEMSEATDQDRCAVSAALYAALASLPDETAIKVFKTLSSDEEDDAAPSVAAIPHAMAPTAG